ncbi:tRNA (guanosine(46)-N7)-methyltransferase TrmB [Virgibacillus ihumii]|uniref:tRNA (guanosine(46)-N7)-methyltransferase TrmB n=1 Tax=Virgibacillus ihumii TaxID=2686091 RepID=UPI00157D8DCE|nr:tRNA (guanosine(46)-N7)-methyltransferase TrmB [Virgibacillus ihumii]
MRQRNKPWADDFLKENEHFIIADPQLNKGSWSEVFGNSNPIYVEIGTGKGQFIAGMAEKYPDVNFIGVELAKSVIVTAAQKIMETDYDNILLINKDAEDLKNIFAMDEISQIYLNFSDPWPKNRHKKRRLTFHTFLEKYRDILQKNGELIFKTDNRGLFEYSLVSFSEFGMTLKEVNLDLHAIDDPGNVMTEYEEKFSAKGQVIYRCRSEF